MRLSLAFAGLAGVVLAACSQAAPSTDTGSPSPQQSPTSGVVIALDRATYSPGSQVQLRITNHTTDQLGFNPCTRSIEHRVATGWALIVERDRVCTMQLYLLEPHATRVESTDLPPSLERGTYRLVLSFTRETAGAERAPAIRAVSPEFQVQ
jgi:hypothetical protein